MEKLLALIPPQYKIAAAAAVGLVVLIALGVVYYHIDQRGYKRCKGEDAVLATEVAKASEQAAQRVASAEIQAMQTTMEEGNERNAFINNIENQIQVARKDGNGPLAPVLHDALGRLRNRQAGRGH